MIQEADRLFRRYMQALGWLGDPGLVELVRTHLIKVPVENVSAILADKRALPDVETFLDGIANQDLGGNAFTNNGYFAELLRYLDYDVELLAADRDGVPFGHAVLQVLHEGRPHLVDVGLGAPFYEPLPLDRLPLRIESGDWHYALEAHSDPGCFALTTTFQGGPASTFVIRPEPRKLSEFSAAIRDYLDPAGAALGRLRLTRIFTWGVATIDNATVAITRHNETQRQALGDLDALADAVEGELQLPRAPIREAVATLSRRGVDVFAS
ncbi:MAG: arylamine N-acetyltransferase [Myxococcales bacterium]|nr:arylamine N-acetyltransferase [Myxococcales bacterium]